VRSRTGNPCSRHAELEILGVAFCGPCTREQEAYFAIGELTREEAHGFRNKSLTEALERMRLERAGGRDGIAAEIHHELLGVDETKPLALTKS
jgi:hypothetical protein